MTQAASTGHLFGLVGPVSGGTAQPLGFYFTGTGFTSVDLSTGNETTPTSAGSYHYSATAAAFDEKTHTMYMQRLESDGKVYLVAIDVASGMPRKIKALERPFKNLVLDPVSNRLFGLSGPGGGGMGAPLGFFFSGTGFTCLDPSTGVEATFSTSGSYYYSATAVAIDPDTHKVYMERLEGDGNVYLVEIDTSTGMVTHKVQLEAPLKNLVFEPTTGQLFGFSGEGIGGIRAPLGYFFQGTGFSNLDPVTGHITPRSTSESYDYSAMGVAHDPNTHTMFMQRAEDDGQVYLLAIDTITGKEKGTSSLSKLRGVANGAVRGFLTGGLPLTSPFNKFAFNASALALIDPVPELLDGPSVIPLPEALATRGRIVQGVAADGVARAVVRIPANHSQETLTITVIDDQGETSKSIGFDGGLLPIHDQSNSPQTVLGGVVAEETGVGSMAFVIYRAPVDFCRGPQDETKADRTVTLRVTSHGYESELEVVIVRPPVVFVHGLWSEAEQWKNDKNHHSPFVIPAIFSPYYVDYGDRVHGIKNTDPDYSSYDPDPRHRIDPFPYTSQITKASLGFYYNAQIARDQIRKHIMAFKHGQNITNTLSEKDYISFAAVQADIVAHSMGGLVSRTMVLLGDSFAHPDTFGQGLIHKLITIGTPHLGSPLAIKLLERENYSLAQLLSDKSMNNYVLNTVTFENGAVVNGAVADLQGDGRGNDLSPALQALVNSESKQPFPTAYIAGTMKENNWAGLDSNSVTAIIRTMYGEWEGCPLALSLTSSGWRDVFGEDNDAIVGLTSQRNGDNKVCSVHKGFIHSHGTEGLGFNGPDELEGNTPIQNKVTTLLNEKRSGADFRQAGE